MKETEKIFARIFSGPDGAHALKYLRDITIERFLGPDATEPRLRDMESRRALVHQIEQMIERGKHGQ